MQFVNKLYSAKPISVLIILSSLYVILASDKIPHQIPPIHIAKLVFKHETEIIDCRWFVYDQIFPVTFQKFHIAVIVNLFLRIRLSKFGYRFLDFIRQLSDGFVVILFGYFIYIDSVLCQIILIWVIGI